MQYKAFTKLLLAIGLAPFFAHAVSSLKESSQPSVNGQYIVVLKSQPKYSFMTTPGFNRMQADFVTTQAQKAANEVGIKVIKKFHRLIDGYVVNANKQQLQELSKQPNVAYVEPNYQLSISPIEKPQSVSSSGFTQDNVDWGLSRIDQHQFDSYDDSYTYQYDGTDVTAYVVDTGLNYTHREFNNDRASVYIDEGDGYVQNPSDVDADCNGHGTHVAGTIGGMNTGVAKNVTLVGVKVLGCDGKGSVMDIVAGLNEVLDLAQPQQSLSHKSVVNMSLGGPEISKTLDDAVDSLVDQGIPVVVAAGNKLDVTDFNLDSCKGSPAHNPNAITVSATDRYDNRASYSYYGKCTDIFAPGTDIESAWRGADDVYNTISGTSMASPHVAGVVALYLQEDSSLTPSEVKQELLQRSTKGAIYGIGSRAGFFANRLARKSPNNLVYSLPN